MVWLYVPGQAAWNLESNWPLEMPTGLSLTVKTKPLLPQSWLRACKRNGWMTLLYGMTSEAFLANSSVERFISSRADTLANHFQMPGGAWDQMIRATSGRKSSALSERYSQKSHSSRTSALILDSDSTKSPEAFRAWATELRRFCLQRRKSARLTAANGYSSWPTATAGSAVGRLPGQTKLHINARNWQTPNAAAEAPNLGSNIKNGPKSLLAQAQPWQTPAAFQGRFRRQVNQTVRAEELLPAQAESVTARAWATPTSRDWKDGSNPSSAAPTSSLLGRQAPRTAMPGDESLPSDQTSRRRLNPKFVLGLMGWPQGWFDLTSSIFWGMASCHSKQPMP